MLGSFIDKLSSLFDQRFIVIYWGPTFIGLGLATLLAGILIGPASAFSWWIGLNTPQQVLLGVVILLIITVLAFLLGTVTIPIVRLYEGYWPEGWLTRWARGRQKQKLQHLSEKLKDLDFKPTLTPNEKRAYLSCKNDRYHYFPLDDTLLKPTRLGNVLVAAEEYPRQLYEMDAVLWWPRMAALMPDTFRTQVDNALTPMLAPLNLSIIFILLALLAAVGEIVVLIIHWNWWLLLITFFSSLLLSWICYIAAVEQAVDYAILVRVAFDLYRQDILKQMHIPLPGDLKEERHLWAALNSWVYDYIMPWQTKGAVGIPLLQEPFHYDTDRNSS